MHPERRAALEALKPGAEPAGWMWADLLADSGTAWPWPYAVVQVDALGAFFDERSRRARQMQVVSLVRQYLAKRHARRHLLKKPDPAAEVAALGAAVDTLLASLDGLSPEAADYLAHPVLRVLAKDAAPSTLYLAAVAFRDANPALQLDYAGQMLEPDALELHASRTPGAATRRGRPPELLRGWLLATLRRIYREAHSGALNMRGYPAFEKAAIAPLKLPVLSAKAMEKARSPAKRRKK